jgi:TrmH family RNA methyltransferase
MSGYWLALDRPADPGNLGTILRTADATGVAGVILLDECVDPYDPLCVRASMGAIFSQKLVHLSATDFLELVKKTSIPVIGSSDHGDNDYSVFPYPQRMVLLMGSEREGMQGVLESSVDALIRIHMAGRSDSLNLAVAASVILYQIYNKYRNEEGRIIS